MVSMITTLEQFIVSTDLPNSTPAYLQAPSSAKAIHFSMVIPSELPSSVESATRILASDESTKHPPKVNASTWGAIVGVGAIELDEEVEEEEEMSVEPIKVVPVVVVVEGPEPTVVVVLAPLVVEAPVVVEVAVDSEIGTGMVEVVVDSEIGTDVVGG